MGISVRATKSSSMIQPGATGQPTIFRVFYTYYLILLILLLISQTFCTMIGYPCYDAIHLIIFQLIFLLPGRVAVQHEFTGYRTIFFVIQGGLILPDMFWMIVAFSKGLIAIGVALMFCALIQGVFFVLAYFQPYTLWPKSFGVLLLQTFVKKRGSHEAAGSPPAPQAQKDWTAHWVKTQFAPDDEEAGELAAFKLEKQKEQLNRMKSSSEEPAFPRTIVVDAYGNRQEDMMKPASARKSRNGKMFVPRLDRSSSTH